MGETRESRGERRIRLVRDDDLDTTDARRQTRLPGGHHGVIRKEGVASLSLKGLVKNAETLQLLPNRSRCLPLHDIPPPTSTTTPSHQGPNSCNQADVPRHLSTPIAFHHQARFTLPAALATKGERTCVCCICKSAGEFSLVRRCFVTRRFRHGSPVRQAPSQHRI